MRIAGVPTAPSFGQYGLQWAQYRVFGTTKLNLVVFHFASERAIAQNYTDLMNANQGNPNYFYWAALRGYTIGTGVGDLGLAYYSYYASLGGYYYSSYSATQPRLANYYYWYYQGLANYYYQLYHGNQAAADSQFAYYVGLANASL